jgi:hypothetical protein
MAQLFTPHGVAIDNEVVIKGGGMPVAVVGKILKLFIIFEVS